MTFRDDKHSRDGSKTHRGLGMCGGLARGHLPEDGW